jgi:hydrogenase expression/formation protein HypC
MCLAVPAKIREITGGVLPMARLDQAGREIDCCLAYLPEAAVGDYVLIQNGFAVTLLDAESADESLAAFAALADAASSDQVASPAAVERSMRPKL